MKKRVKRLSFTVAMTVSLLGIGATLAVLGIVDDMLNRDIFSPQVEQLLRAIMAGCIVLSVLGVAITFVLGIQEIVKSIGLLQKSRGLDELETVTDAPKTTYMLYMSGFVAVLCGVN